MYLKKILFILLLTLITSGCMSKGADGRYKSNYSYHPYYKLYKDKMIDKSKKKRAKKLKPIIRYNDEELFPSNVPASNSYSSNY